MKKREHIIPDLTPIIDIVFLILIFFMVSSTFKKEEMALLLNLPKANSATIEVERENINIELGKETLAYKGKEMQFDMLDVMLKEVTQKDKPVHIRIDKEVSYGRVTRLFDMLNKYGLNNLALENERSK